MGTTEAVLTRGVFAGKSVVLFPQQTLPELDEYSEVFGSLFSSEFVDVSPALRSGALQILGNTAAQWTKEPVSEQQERYRWLWLKTCACVYLTSSIHQVVDVVPKATWAADAPAQRYLLSGEVKRSSFGLAQGETDLFRTRGAELGLWMLREVHSALYTEAVKTPPARASGPLGGAVLVELAEALAAPKMWVIVSPEVASCWSRLGLCGPAGSLEPRKVVTPTGEVQATILVDPYQSTREVIAGVVPSGVGSVGTWYPYAFGDEYVSEPWYGMKASVTTELKLAPTPRCILKELSGIPRYY